MITDWSANAFMILVIAGGLFKVLGGIYPIFRGHSGPQLRQMAIKGALDIAAASICLTLLRNGVVDAGWPLIVGALLPAVSLSLYFKWTDSRDPSNAEDGPQRANWIKTHARGRRRFILNTMSATALGGAWAFAYLKILLWDHIPMLVGAFFITGFIVWGYATANRSWTENERKYYEPPTAPDMQ